MTTAPLSPAALALFFNDLFGDGAIERITDAPAPARQFVDLGQQKSGRRTKADMGVIRRAIFNVVIANQPMTVRQVFYALTVQGVIGKTEQEYKGTVVRLLTAMRRAGELPYSWISDNTRCLRKPASYSGLASALQHTAR